MRMQLLIVPLLTMMLGVSACTFEQPPPPVAANPYPPVPPRQPELQPKPPVSEDLMTWRMGGWEWAGNGYVWQPGEWVKLDGHSNQFLPGHWAVVNGVWTWERGHWL